MHLYCLTCVPTVSTQYRVYSFGNPDSPLVVRPQLLPTNSRTRRIKWNALTSLKPFYSDFIINMFFWNKQILHSGLSANLLYSNKQEKNGTRNQVEVETNSKGTYMPRRVSSSQDRTVTGNVTFSLAYPVSLSLRLVSLHLFCKLS